MLLQETAPATRVNIGCGYDKRDGYLNIDSDPACQPDYLVHDNDLSALPQNHFSEAIALDVLEHIPRGHMMGALYDWAALLKLGGRMFVETSSIFGIIDVMRSASDFETIHNWKRCLFGNQAHPGDWHYNGFTEATLPVYLRAVGFKTEPVELRDRWLLRVWATKTEDWSDLEHIANYSEFLRIAYERILNRAPEDAVYSRTPSLPDSRERRAEIKTLVTSEERLYLLGR